MDRLPAQGASFGNHTFQTLQQQQPTRARHPSTQKQPIASYRPALPSESQMPDEWGYPSSRIPQDSNIPRNIQGPVPHLMIASGSAPPGALHLTAAAGPQVPTCRYLNCYRPVIRDEKTHELTEYCSLEHMRPSGLPSDAVQRLGYPVCPACMHCPRRSDRDFCGFLCEEWAMQQLRRQQQLQSQQRQQQEHYQQQQRQHWQSPTIRPSPIVPYHSAVTWSNAARGPVYANNVAVIPYPIWQGRFQH